MAELTFDEKERLIRLLMEIRNNGMIGMLEVRNVLGRLFEDFEAVRDGDVDELIRQLAQERQGNHNDPSQLQLT